MGHFDHSNLHDVPVHRGWDFSLENAPQTFLRLPFTFPLRHSQLHLPHARVSLVLANDAIFEHLLYNRHATLPICKLFSRCQVAVT